METRTQTSQTLPNPFSLLKPKRLLAGVTYALLASHKALGARDTFAPGPGPALAPAPSPAKPLYCNPPLPAADRCNLAQTANSCPSFASADPALDDGTLYKVTGVGGFDPHARGMELCEEVIEAAQSDRACYGPVDNTPCGPQQPDLSCGNAKNQLCALEGAENMCADKPGMGTAGQLAKALSTSGGGSKAPVLVPSSTVAATCASVKKRAAQLSTLCPPNTLKGSC